MTSSGEHTDLCFMQHTNVVTAHNSMNVHQHRQQNNDRNQNVGSMAMIEDSNNNSNSNSNSIHQLINNVLTITQNVERMFIEQQKKTDVAFRELIKRIDKINSDQLALHTLVMQHHQLYLSDRLENVHNREDINGSSSSSIDSTTVFDDISQSLEFATTNLNTFLQQTYSQHHPSTHTPLLTNNASSYENYSSSFNQQHYPSSHAFAPPVFTPLPPPVADLRWITIPQETITSIQPFVSLSLPLTLTQPVVSIPPLVLPPDHPLQSPTSDHEAACNSIASQENVSTTEAPMDDYACNNDDECEEEQLSQGTVDVSRSQIIDDSLPAPPQQPQTNSGSPTSDEIVDTHLQALNNPQTILVHTCATATDAATATAVSSTIVDASIPTLQQLKEKTTPVLPQRRTRGKTCQEKLDAQKEKKRQKIADKEAAKYNNAAKVAIGTTAQYKTTPVVPDRNTATPSVPVAVPVAPTKTTTRITRQTKTPAATTVARSLSPNKEIISKPIVLLQNTDLFRNISAVIKTLVANQNTKFFNTQTNKLNRAMFNYFLGQHNIECDSDDLREFVLQKSLKDFE